MSGMVETCCGMERGVYSFIERGQRLSEREATHMHLQGASNGGFRQSDVSKRRSELRPQEWMVQMAF